MDGDQGRENASKTSENAHNKSPRQLGLTTRVALETLQRDIKRVSQDYEEMCKRNK